jgi:D-alanyl-D-alanine endopeptidase (penicillin-binding protein 7)
MKKLLLLLLFPLICSANEITAKSWLVAENGHIISGKNTTEVRSIGSITKLVTVMVYLDAYKSLTSKNHQELVQRALVRSDNHAAKRLCEDYPGGKDDCIFMMNLKAKELGLVNTKFVEPTGLSVFNSSSAEELVKIVEAASAYPEIVNASRTVKGNTNSTIGKYEYTVSKTGYIHLAGGCIVAKVKDKIVVILGSKNVHTRIPELEKLLRL